MGLVVDFSKLDAMDFLDVAIEVEREAQEHYEQLVEWMTAVSDPAVVEFFTAMAGREARHREHLVVQRQEMFGERPPQHEIGKVPWQVEAPDFASVRDDMTLRQALEMSLAMEVRAHDYYAEAKEYARDARVEELLEGFRLAELEHQRLVRAELAKLG